MLREGPVYYLIPFKGRLGKNTAALLLSNGGSAVLSFALAIMIGRGFGEAGLGLYSAVLAWIFPLSLLVEFGLGTLITRDLAQQPSQTSAYVRQAVLARLIPGTALILTILFVAPLLSGDEGFVAGLHLSAPLIAIFALFGTFTAVMRAFQRMAPILWLNIGMLLAQVGLTGFILAQKGSLAQIFMVNTLTSGGQLIAAWIVYRSMMRSAKLAQESPIHLSTTRMLKRAWPFALAAILAALQTRIGIVMVESWSSSAETGYFAASFRFVEAGRMIPNALFGAIFPALSAMGANPASLSHLFDRISGGLLLYGLCFGALVASSAGFLLTLFGTSFSAGGFSLQLAAWSLLPSLLRSGLTLYWYAQGRESLVNRVTIVLVALQVAVGWLLIPPMGAAGAALTYLLVETVGFLLLSRSAMRFYAA